MLASLNHPNIAAIYGFEEAENKSFLVMELVEGETLSEWLKRSGSPGLAVEDGLSIGKQLAEALEAAHERGVIHSDLKPANVKITSEGKVKVFDFGLAKALAGAEEAQQAEIANSPTITADFTRPGVVLGTAAYMSPEPARGKPVDKRTDIWSFGCVLYECFGGRRPFDGETATDLIAKILEREPDWENLSTATPPGVKALIQRCLKKNRRERRVRAGICLAIRSRTTAPRLRRCGPRHHVTPRFRRLVRASQGSGHHDTSNEKDNRYSSCPKKHLYFLRLRSSSTRFPPLSMGRKFSITQTSQRTGVPAVNAMRRPSG